MFNNQYLKGFSTENLQVLKDAGNKRNLQEKFVLFVKLEKTCLANLQKNGITFSGSFNGACQGILRIVQPNTSIQPRGSQQLQ